MATHYSSDFKVKPYTVLLPYTSKDGTKQVAIRVRVIERSTKNDQRFDIVCKNKADEPIKLSPAAFKSNKYDIKLKNRIADIDERVKFATHHFLTHNLTISKKKITEFVYNRMENETNKVFSNENVDDPIILEQLENLGIEIPIAKDVVNTVASLRDDEMNDDETGEQIDIENIIIGIQSEYDRKKQDEEIDKMGLDERYKKGYFDKSNIFDVFGYCWSTNKNTNKPFVSNTYKSLILKLADFRVNGQPNEHVSMFNDKWVNEFILFLKNEGYANVHPKNYSPFSIRNLDFKLLAAEREPYVYKSFEKQIKHLKFYIENLQKQELMSKTCVDTRFIKTSDYFGGNSINYTRASHALTKSEIELILNSQLEGKMETARQMFLTQIFAGGLRNEEFFNKYFKMAYQNELYYFMWYADKGDKAVENPLIEGYSDVLLDQLGYSLPDFLKIDEYRSNLKKMAKELNLDRIIRYKVPEAKTGENRVIDKRIHEIINPYFCRKTFVRFAYSLGWSSDKIIQWTGHGDTKTLKHYFDQLSAEEKKNI